MYLQYNNLTQTIGSKYGVKGCWLPAHICLQIDFLLTLCFEKCFDPILKGGTINLTNDDINSSLIFAAFMITCGRLPEYFSRLRLNSQTRTDKWTTLHVSEDASGSDRETSIELQCLMTKGLLVSFQHSHAHKPSLLRL